MSFANARTLHCACLLSATAFAAIVIAAPAEAQQTWSEVSNAGQAEPQVPVAPAAVGTSVLPADAPAAPLSATEAEAAKFKRFDQLAEPGLTTLVPGSADSILRDVGGFRSWLAEHDIGLQARLTAVGVYNPLETGQPRNPQRYNGQRPTLQFQATNVIGTFGLGKIGLPNSRLIIGYNSQLTSFDPNGKNTVGVRNLAYYQSFSDGAIELKFGIMPNYYEFVGLFAGGSPILSSGLTGLIPIQAGLSADPVSTPTANMTFHFEKGAYVKLGLQRSTPPAGTNYELEQRRFGLAFTMKDAGPMAIAEIGVKRPSSKGGKQIWVRAGGMYNQSNYTRFDGRGTAANQTLYGAADFQVTQPDLARPGKGFYAGASAFWAPDSVNTMTQFYEGRVYQIAPFEARPLDSVAMRVGYTKYSSDAIHSNRLRGLEANNHQFSVTGSYTFHVTQGVYLTPAAAYLENPSFIGRFKDALNLSGTLYVLL